MEKAPATERPPIVCIVGKSDSGKTTLIEKLIKELTGRGHRVATIKHDTHSFDVDHPGKDSWRHREAGAAAVVISSPNRLFLTQNLDSPLQLKQIRDRYLGFYDLIIAEGFKRSEEQKIEVHRNERSDELICLAEADNLIAVASDTTWDLPVPVFHIDDGRSIALFIEDRFINHIE